MRNNASALANSTAKALRTKDSAPRTTFVTNARFPVTFVRSLLDFIFMNEALKMLQEASSSLLYPLFEEGSLEPTSWRVPKLSHAVCCVPVPFGAPKTPY
ncbi:hypothetical protein L596_022914 [Steinernema carpocapsae]|uniref:Uncharacterized protein n=1 Tax=Steinernema carpocapsae TaxID=34508 RepID=A0A4U5MBZ2_STECR|nr:hypothetical protein L596_022914 [Steinernema carpocapsae]